MVELSATASSHEKPQKQKKRSIWVKRPHQRVEALTSLVPTSTAVISPIAITTVGWFLPSHQTLNATSPNIALLGLLSQRIKEPWWTAELGDEGTRFHITGLRFPQYGQSSSNCLIVQSWIRHLIQTNVSLSSSLILVICVIVFSLDCRSYAEPTEYIIECDDILVMKSLILQRQ